MLQIYCKNNNLTKDFPEGSTLLDIYNGFNLEMPYGPVSAKVNNKVEGLNFKVYYNKDIENDLESSAEDGDSPVFEARRSIAVS